jgi:hypothetical protein
MMMTMKLNVVNMDPVVYEYCPIRPRPRRPPQGTPVLIARRRRPTLVRGIVFLD